MNADRELLDVGRALVGVGVIQVEIAEGHG
jgi:hypothetical protein